MRSDEGNPLQKKLSLKSLKTIMINVRIPKIKLALLPS